MAKWSDDDDDEPLWTQHLGYESEKTKRKNKKRLNDLLSSGLKKKGRKKKGRKKKGKKGKKGVRGRKVNGVRGRKVNGVRGRKVNGVYLSDKLLKLLAEIVCTCKK